MIDLPTQLASEQFAARIAACLISPLTLTCSGESGAGKTVISLEEIQTGADLRMSRLNTAFGAMD